MPFDGCHNVSSEQATMLCSQAGNNSQRTSHASKQAPRRTSEPAAVVGSTRKPDESGENIKTWLFKQSDNWDVINGPLQGKSAANFEDSSLQTASKVTDELHQESLDAQAMVNRANELDE